MTIPIRFALPALLASWTFVAGAEGTSTPTAPSPAGPRSAGTGPTEAWRGARWEMTPAEVLAAFPGEAFRVEPEVRLDDGNTVAVGIDGLAFEGLTFRVRFLFEKGKLALVSLRTEPATYLDAPAYEKIRKTLVDRWGSPIETARDDAFIDMRQTRWNRGSSRADLKYIPGVVVLLHYPRPPG
jgi:hypothetical protein